MKQHRKAIRDRKRESESDNSLCCQHCAKLMAPVGTVTSQPVLSSTNSCPPKGRDQQAPRGSGLQVAFQRRSEVQEDPSPVDRTLLPKLPSLRNVPGDSGSITSPVSVQPVTTAQPVLGRSTSSMGFAYL